MLLVIGNFGVKLSMGRSCRTHSENACVYLFNISRLVQEITLKLQSECLWQFQPPLSTRCKIVPNELIHSKTTWWDAAWEHVVVTARSACHREPFFLFFSMLLTNMDYFKLKFCFGHVSGSSGTWWGMTPSRTWKRSSLNMAWTRLETKPLSATRRRSCWSCPAFLTGNEKKIGAPWRDAESLNGCSVHRW